MVRVALFGKAVIRHLSPSLIATADSIDFEIEAKELERRGRQREGDVEAQKAKEKLEQGLQRFKDQAPVGVVKGVKGKGLKALKGVERVVDDQGVAWAKPLAGLDAWDKVPDIVGPKTRGSGLNNINSISNSNFAGDDTIAGRLRSRSSSSYGSATSRDVAIPNNNNITNNNNRTRNMVQFHATSCGNLAVAGTSRGKRLRQGSVGSLNDLSFSSVCSSTLAVDMPNR